MRHENAALEEVALTTNGLLLTRRLPGLQAAGVTGVNVSLDTLREDVFRRMTRRAGVQRVRDAISAAVAAGLPSPVKVNAVVIGGVNEDSVPDMARLAGACLQRHGASTLHRVTRLRRVTAAAHAFHRVHAVR